MASTSPSSSAPKASAAQVIETSKLTKGGNERNIPEVVFIENVPAFLEQLGGVQVEVAIGAFNELYSKFKMFEENLVSTRTNLKNKIPEIERSFDLVQHLMAKQHEQGKIKTSYNLCDLVYCSAELETDGRVCIWLGANVMVEFTHDQAFEMLDKSKTNAIQRLKECEVDLELLRNNATTVEVNIARLFNWDVRRRRDEAALAVAKK